MKGALKKGKVFCTIFHSTKMSTPLWLYAISFYLTLLHRTLSVPVAARSKAYVCGRSPSEIVGSNPTRAWMFVLLCCQVEVSATS